MAENRLDLNSFPTIIDVPRERTASLLAKVLGITSLGFLITAFGVATAPPWGTLPGLIAVFALVFGISFARKANPALALGLFLALTYFMGWQIGPLIHRYIQTVGSAVVFQAAATTGLGMAAMGCVAYLFQINYRRIAGIGFAALLLLIIAGIASMFFHFMTPGHLFVADAGDFYAAYRRRLRTHPCWWRRSVRGFAFALDLSRRDQHLSRCAAAAEWTPQELKTFKKPDTLLPIARARSRPFVNHLVTLRDRKPCRIWIRQV